MVIIPVLILLLEVILKIQVDYIFFILCLVLWIAVPVVLNIISKKLKKKLEIIGELTVTTSMIKRSINGKDENFEFQKIENLEIERLLRKIFFPSNKDSSQVYLVTMDYADQNHDQFVISSQSEDKPETNFLDIIKSIEKRMKISLIKAK
jgi:hypothetical protein